MGWIKTLEVKLMVARGAGEDDEGKGISWRGEDTGVETRGHVRTVRDTGVETRPFAIGLSSVPWPREPV